MGHWLAFDAIAFENFAAWIPEGTRYAFAVYACHSVISSVFAPDGVMTDDLRALLLSGSWYVDDADIIFLGLSEDRAREFFSPLVSSLVFKHRKAFVSSFKLFRYTVEPYQSSFRFSFDELLATSPFPDLPSV